VAEQIQVPGGTEAVQLRVAEQYIARFGELAKAGNTFVIPANIADLTSMFALATNILGSKQGAAGVPPAGPSAAPPTRPSPQPSAPMR